MHTNHRILVIDDNRAIHDDFRKILSPARGLIDQAETEFFSGPEPLPHQPTFEIDSAFQGEEGIAALKLALEQGRPYAMAFVDVRMPPGMDGIETAERLWQLCPDLQIVICTAHSDYSWQQMIARLGHRDRLLVLKKPFAAIEAQQLACALCEKWRLTRDSQKRLMETEKLVEERTSELRDTNGRLETEIEQRRQAERHLIRTQRLESIGTLASGIAHDLNNMLSPILMSAQLLRDAVHSEAHREMVATIETSAERAAAVVRQVLTFARGVEGQRVLMQPRHLLREISAIVAGTFPKNIRVLCDLPKDLGCTEADATQLHQVLMNLCVNARDAMPDGGTLRISAENVEIDEEFARITPDAHAGGYVTLRIADTGSGIPPAIIEKIFDPFFTTKPLGKGTGLGLSTVLGIVKGHGGFVDVRSAPGRGSTFEICLPLAAQEGVGIRDAAEHPSGNGELILLVDDEFEVRATTTAVLTQYGYRVISAADGAEAVSVYAQRSNEICLVITDVMMPVVDGVSLCRVLRRMNPEISLIACTGYAAEARTHELRALKVHTVLSKPFSLGTLLVAVDEAIQSQPASRPALCA